MDKESGRNKLNTAKKGFLNAIEQAKKEAVKRIDQDDNGKLDINDAVAIASNVGAAAENAVASIKETANASRKQMAERISQNRAERELRELDPIFDEELSNPGFFLSKLIRVTSMDKRHSESELCRGSIGHRSVYKDVTVVNIYRDYVDSYGLTFYPNMDGEVYYVDPVDRNHYIEMNEYFDHLKQVRVAELQRIAQSLGATHFKVAYREESKSITDRRIKVGATLKLPDKQEGSVSADSSRQNEQSSSYAVAAEMYCEGHEPEMPELKYFQNDPSIQSLVELRMAKNPITHQKYTLHCSNSVGIKEMDAIKIDGVLSAMKCSGNTKVISEALDEARRSFEYEIWF